MRWHLLLSRRCAGSALFPWRIVALLFLAGGAGSGFLVWATASGAVETDTPAIIKQRQTDMRDIADSAKMIAQTFARKQPYDKAALLEAVEIIRARAGKPLASSFPADTLGGVSSALPVIEDERDKFTAIAAELERLAERFSQAVENSPNALGEDMLMSAQGALANPLLKSRRAPESEDFGALPAEHLFHLMLQTCTSCHARYRQAKD